MKRIYVHRWESPLGELILGSIGSKLCLCDWSEGRKRSDIDRRLCRLLEAEFATGLTPVTEQALCQLGEYFAGLRREFDLTLQFAGSPFQCRVWEELTRIPYGETIPYGELARRVGNPRSMRAVAAANSVNAISVFVPCHRVIGANGTLTGYSGGLATKQALLELEYRTALEWAVNNIYRHD